MSYIQFITLDSRFKIEQCFIEFPPHKSSRYCCIIIKKSGEIFVIKDQDKCLTFLCLSFCGTISERELLFFYFPSKVSPEAKTAQDMFPSVSRQRFPRTITGFADPCPI